MTLIRVDEIRAALISALLANTTITAELTDATEIREFNWKGTEFSYPNVRVRIVEATTSESAACPQEFNGSIYVFSEEASSMQADQIAGIIADEYYHSSLESEGIFFTSLYTNIIGAIQQDQLTWRSEIIINSMIQRV